MKYSLLVLLVSILPVLASPPVFGTMEYIKYQGSTMDIGGLSDPFVVDWDGDGLQDLIVGQYYDHHAPPIDHGKIRFFPNQGTSTVPVYNTFDYIEADGEDIICNYG